MNGVTVSAAGDGTNLSIKGIDSKTFSKIHGGTRNDVSFQIEAAQNAENGSYPITIKLTYKDENGKEYACAIDLSGTEFAEVSNLSQEPPLMGLVAGAERTENSISLIRYIFDPAVTK